MSNSWRCSPNRVFDRLPLISDTMAGITREEEEKKSLILIHIVSLEIKKLTFMHLPNF
jgi:hypothetical protein